MLAATPPPAAGEELSLSANPLADARGTTISFRVPEGDATVRVAVYSVTGRRIFTLTRGRREGGPHTAHWSGRDGNGGRVPPGIYLLQVRIGKQVRTERLLLLN